MVGGYIMFRCVELACRSQSQFASKNARGAVIVFAMIGVLVTGFLTLNMMMSGRSLGSALAPFVAGPALRETTGATGSAPTHPENCRDPHEIRGISGTCFCESGYHEDPTLLRCVRD